MGKNLRDDTIARILTTLERLSDAERTVRRPALDEPPGRSGPLSALYCNAKIMLGGDLLAVLTELDEAFGGGKEMRPVRFNFFGTPAVLVTKPEHVDTVFKDTQHFSMSAEPKTLERFGDLLGFNLVAADKQTWARVRPRTAAALTGSSLREHGEVMRAVMGEDVLPRLRRAAAHDEVLDVFETMLEFSSKAVFRAFMRLPGHAVPDAVHGALSRLFDHVRTHVLEPGVPLWVPSPANKAFFRDRDVVRDFVGPQMDGHARLDTLMGTTVRGHTERVRGRTREDIEAVTAELWAAYGAEHSLPSAELRSGVAELLAAGEREQATVFDIGKRLVKLGRTHAKQHELELIVAERVLQAQLEAVLCRDGHIDRERVLQEMVSNLIGGSETTILMMSWGLYYLARNPEAQDRLREEALQAGEDPVPSIEVSELRRKWPYLFNVLREILRLASPAAAFNRPVIAETELDGFRLPAGTLVWGSQYITHRSPHVWDQPEAFMPERFDEPVAPGSFFPFTLGPRMCVGMNYAYLEAAYALVTFCRHFHVECLEREVGYDMGLTFRPDRPIRVRLRRRGA